MLNLFDTCDVIFYAIESKLPRYNILLLKQNLEEEEVL